MRSDQIKKGVERAPNRSLLYALGYTEEELNRPLVGVVSSWNEIVPGHMDLDKIVEAVKAGIRAAGGTPVTFPAIAVCDGIAMGHVGMKYSLVTRDLIADSTEAMAIAHQFDGLVMIPNCDKNVPGLLMAAARVNVPTIFCSGGPMLAGRLGDGRRTCLSHMFEAVGAYHAGTLDEAGVEVRQLDLEWNRLDYEYYEKYLSEHLRDVKWSDAVFASDMGAIACYRFVTERGIQVPDHMKIMAYDGTDFTRMMMPVMTAVRQDITKLASSCADTVVRLVQRKEPVRMHRIIDVEFQKGGTT